MIIQIRGTSGSGKTWAMNRVMELMGEWTGEYEIGRKKPLYYRSESEWPLTCVLGHYESACGGCDNIGSAPKVYDLYHRLLQDYDRPLTLLSEGLLLSEDTKWSSKLSTKPGDPFELRVVYLSTRVDKCIEQINERRRAAGKADPVNEKNTRNRVAVIKRSRVKLRDAGYRTPTCSPRQAVELITNWIRESDAK